MKFRILIRRLCWKMFGLPNVPPMEIEIYYMSPKFHYERIWNLYRAGISIKGIAERFNIPRERVIQCLWKCYRKWENENI